MGGVGERMKIKNSVRLLLLFFTIFPLAIFGFFSISYASQKIEKMTEDNVQAVSTNQIMNIQNFCKEREQEMETVASFQLIKDAISYSLGRFGKEPDRDYLDNLLKEQKRHSDMVASLSILDKDFHVVGSSEQYERSEDSELKNAKERYQTGDFVIGNVYERQTDDGLKKVVPAYIGVYFDSELIGYVAEEIDTSYFDDLRLNMDSLAEGTFYLVDGNGAIITAGDTKQKESIRQFTSTSKDRSDFQEKWDAIDHEADPAGEIHYTYQGMNYITYYSNVENTDWGVRISENVSAQTESVRNYSFLVLLTIVFLGSGMLAAEGMITQKLLSPIDRILDTFAQIRRTQDYSLRIPVGSKDEMAQLSEGVNELLSFIEREDMHEKARQRQLKELAECDPLTGIKNKKAIEQTMLSMAQKAEESGMQISVGFVDIDDFRDYNTKYGHQEGDEVIRFVARILMEELHGQVGRNGGDEFVFCYLGALDRMQIEETLETIRKRLNTDYFSEKYGCQIPVPCSIGAVTARGRGLDYAYLVQRADEAMYEAKNAGKNTYHVTEEIRE